MWHLKVWWTRPDGSTSRRGSTPWTATELLRKVFGTERTDIENQSNLYKNWTGSKKKERPGDGNAVKIAEAIFENQPQFLIWADDLERARERTLGAGKNKLTITIEGCLATLAANGYTNSQEALPAENNRKHIGAAASAGVSLITHELAKHFYGRESDLALIDDFVNARMKGGERGLLLITAPAGYGKSALATAWCNEAEAVPNRTIAKHLCSIRTGEATISIRKIHANFRRQISEVYADGIDASDDDDALTALLARTPPNGMQLVIWLDGIDEASTPVGCFLPAKLGDRVCVIVSARAEQNAEPQPGYIDEWTSSPQAKPHLPYRHNLTKLSLNGIESMVAGFFRAENLKQPKLLAQRIFDASEQGYPLFARLMADDAVTAARASGEIVVGSTVQSIAEYADRQLKSLQKLDSWATYQPLFVFLTFAGGPVRIEELPSLIGQTILPEAIPDQIFRWFDLGQARDTVQPRTLAMAHSKLAEIFGKTLRQIRQPAIDALLNRIDEIPRHKWPSYAWRYLPQHLAEAGRMEQAAQLLCDTSFISSRFDALGAEIAPDVMDSDWHVWLRATWQANRRGSEGANKNLHLTFWSHYAKKFTALASQGFPAVWRQMFYDVELATTKVSPGFIRPKRCSSTAAFFAEHATGPHHRALVLRDNSGFLTLPYARSLALWSAEEEELATLSGHTSFVKGAIELNDGEGFLSWSLDNTLRLWGANGEQGPVLEGHENHPRGALQLSSDRGFLSWGDDNTLRFWGQNGEAGKVLRGHNNEVVGALALDDDEGFLSWSYDGTLRLWGPGGDEGPVLSGHTSRVFGATKRAGGAGFLSWAYDHTLRLWGPAGEEVRVLRGHEYSADGVLVLEGGAGYLTWSSGSELRIWSPDGDAGPVMVGHEGRVCGALALENGSGFLSWSYDGTLRLWGPNGEKGPVLRGHTNAVVGAVSLPNGNGFVSHSWDNTVRVWSREGELKNLWLTPSRPVDYLYQCGPRDHYLAIFHGNIGIVHLPADK